MNNWYLIGPHIVRFVRFIRQKEAEAMRGNLLRIEELEATSDATLLCKWLLLISIVASGLCFLGLPFIMLLIQNFLPAEILGGLWAVVKISMGASLLMFLLSIYFTTHKDSL